MKENSADCNLPYFGASLFMNSYTEICAIKSEMCKRWRFHHTYRNAMKVCSLKKTHSALDQIAKLCHHGADMQTSMSQWCALIMNSMDKRAWMRPCPGLWLRNTLHSCRRSSNMIQGPFVLSQRYMQARPPPNVYPQIWSLNQIRSVCPDYFQVRMGLGDFSLALPTPLKTTKYKWLTIETISIIKSYSASVASLTMFWSMPNFSVGTHTCLPLTSRLRFASLRKWFHLTWQSFFFLEAMGGGVTNALSPH